MSDKDLFTLSKCTLADLIEAGEAYLTRHSLVYGHGTDNPFDEAAWLALEACDLSPAEPLESYDVPVTAIQLKRAQDWFKRRAVDKIPTAYITGRAWFAGLEFDVDERALIPRSPIAELILDQFSPWLVESPQAVLDLCCGGGCIAIAIANVFPACTVDAIDLSADALELASINVAKHNMKNRVSLYQGDLFSPLEKSRKYDLIVSNPPYVDGRDMRGIAAEFTREPQMGLAAGDDGLDIVERILADAKAFLEPNGLLIIEVGNSKEAVEKRFMQLDIMWFEFEYGGDGVFLVNAASL